MPALTATLFLSAFLLFSAQPMFAKMVLPLLGGSPSVWNTCLVFFQTALLAGYAASHALLKKGEKKLVSPFFLHFIVMASAFLFLPPHLASDLPPVDSTPIPWLLKNLTLGIGLPFFALSTLAPLLQNRFSRTRHPAAQDPYFLYAASNAGSLTALLSYPFLLEPALSLKTQSNLWAAGYGLLTILLIISLLMTRPSENTGKQPATQQTGTRKWKWLLYSFIPSSLMMGVTTYLSTDIASVPLLWIAPLALYLLSFIIVFARKPLVSSSFLILPFILLILTLVTTMTRSLSLAVETVLTLHLFTFFVTALLFHGKLARSRPDVAHLTEFYLWLSVGGALGGFFNALLAPLIFSQVIEYPIILALACFAGMEKTQTPKRSSLLIATGLVAFVSGLCFYHQKIYGLAHPNIFLNAAINLLLISAPAVLCFLFRARAISFGLCVSVLFLTHALMQNYYSHRTREKPVFLARNFFGVSKVVDQKDAIRIYLNGKVTHGQQSLQGENVGEPLAYYHRQGPIGQILNLLEGVPDQRIAAIGLGVGSLAAYGKEDQQWDFYEIDPLVKKIATDASLFGFLKSSRARIKIILGDGRLMLGRAPERSYDLIILDAFSSDSIPIHLLTQEAFGLYLEKLSDSGFFALHISNKSLDLAPVVAGNARALGLLCYVQDDRGQESALAPGKLPSIWAVVLSGDHGLNSFLLKDPRWREISRAQKNAGWTDQRSNILSALK